MIRPGGQDIKPFLKDGYLTEGATLEDLAGKLGIDPIGLKDSVKRMKDYAGTGVDTDFSRGTTVYEKANGDPSHGPNPTLGALENRSEEHTSEPQELMRTQYHVFRFKN